MNLLLVSQGSASLIALLIALVCSLAVGMALSPNDDGDDDNDSAVKDFKEKADKIKADDNDTDEEVEVKEGEDDDEEDKSPRAEKRRNRFRENQQSREQAERDRDQERERAGRLEQENQLFRAQLTDVLSRVNQNPREDPADAALKQIEENQESLLAEFRARERAGTLTPEDEKALRTRMRALNAQEVQIQSSRSVQQALAQAGQGRNTEQQVIAATFASKYPDIMADPRASQLVQTEEKKLLIMGRPRGWSTIDEAVKNTRKALGMGGDTSETVRRRFTGTRSAGGGGNASEDTRKVPITKMDKKIMRARWPHLSEAKQIKMIAKEKLAVQRQSRSRED